MKIMNTDKEIKITPDILRQIQMKQLEVMVEVDRICREKGWRYYMIAGTLLGAVRHKGFIPWDDDLDIGMPRADYESFIDNAQSLLSDSYFLQNYKTEKNCFSPFSKIRINGTVFREQAVAHVQCHHGIYIDIFPLDFVPDDPQVRRRNAFLCAQLKKISMVKLNIREKGKALDFFRSMIGCILPNKWFHAWINQIVSRQRYATSGYMSNALSPTGVENWLLTNEQYGKPVELLFEGHKFFAPAAYEQLLKKRYGNYMELPPEDKRGGWHAVTEVNVREGRGCTCE